MVLDVPANVIAVLFRHDDICNYYVWLGALNRRQGLRRIVTRNHIDVLAAKGDFNHLAHGGAVIDKVDRWGRGGGGTHRIKPPSASASVCAASSTSRRASSISSVADRST